MTVTPNGTIAKRQAGSVSFNVGQVSRTSSVNSSRSAYRGGRASVHDQTRITNAVHTLKDATTSANIRVRGVTVTARIWAMAMRSRARSWLSDRTTHVGLVGDPRLRRSRWLRWWGTAVLVLLPIEMFTKRGVVVGVVAVVVYGGMALLSALAREDWREWVHRHPVWGRMLPGPVVFLTVAYVSTWPLWVCAIAGAAALGVGAASGAVGARRARLDAA